MKKQELASKIIKLRSRLYDLHEKSLNIWESKTTENGLTIHRNREKKNEEFQTIMDTIDNIVWSSERYEELAEKGADSVIAKLEISTIKELEVALKEFKKVEEDLIFDIEKLEEEEE